MNLVTTALLKLLKRIERAKWEADAKAAMARRALLNG